MKHEKCSPMSVDEKNLNDGIWCDGQCIIINTYRIVWWYGNLPRMMVV